MAFAGPGPCCGLGAGSARAEAMGRAGLLPVLGRERQNEPAFSFFSWKIENANWLKRKIEKSIFPVGKIQENEFIFFPLRI